MTYLCPAPFVCDHLVELASAKSLITMAGNDEDSFQQFMYRFEDEVLSLAYYIKDRDLICSFLPNSTTYNVHPHLWMLTALEEFITNVRVDKTGEVVSMLEYLHSQYPSVGDGKEYAKLLVDMKTKAFSYELFAKGDLSQDEKRAVLDKYFGSELCDSNHSMDDPNLTDEEYLATIHGLARIVGEGVITSRERCLEFQTIILNPVYSPTVHENFVKNLTSYLNKIKLQLPVPLLLQSFASTYASEPVTKHTYAEMLLDNDPRPDRVGEPSSPRRKQTATTRSGRLTKKRGVVKKLVEVRVTPCEKIQSETDHISQDSQISDFETDSTVGSKPGTSKRKGPLTPESSKRRSSLRFRSSERMHSSESASLKRRKSSRVQTTTKKQTYYFSDTSSSSSESELTDKSLSAESAIAVRKSPRRRTLRLSSPEDKKNSAQRKPVTRSKSLRSLRSKKTEDTETMISASDDAVDDEEIFTDDTIISKRTRKREANVTSSADGGIFTDDMVSKHTRKGETKVTASTGMKVKTRSSRRRSGTRKYDSETDSLSQSQELTSSAPSESDSEFLPSYAIHLNKQTVEHSDGLSRISEPSPAKSSKIDESKRGEAALKQGHKESPLLARKSTSTKATSRSPSIKDNQMDDEETESESEPRSTKADLISSPSRRPVLKRKAKEAASPKRSNVRKSPRLVCAKMSAENILDEIATESDDDFEEGKKKGDLERNTKTSPTISQKPKPTTSGRPKDLQIFNLLQKYEDNQTKLKPLTVSGYAYRAITSFKKATCFMCNKAFTSPTGFEKHIAMCNPPGCLHSTVPIELVLGGEGRDRPRSVVEDTSPTISQKPKPTTSGRPKDLQIFNLLHKYEDNQTKLKPLTVSGYAYRAITSYKKATCFMCNKGFTSPTGFEKHVSMCNPPGCLHSTVPIELGEGGDGPCSVVEDTDKEQDSGHSSESKRSSVKKSPRLSPAKMSAENILDKTTTEDDGDCEEGKKEGDLEKKNRASPRKRSRHSSDSKVLQQKTYQSKETDSPSKLKSYPLRKRKIERLAHSSSSSSSDMRKPSGDENEKQPRGLRKEKLLAATRNIGEPQPEDATVKQSKFILAMDSDDSNNAPPSLTESFKKPRKRLKYDATDSERDSDSTADGKNAAKKVRFADHSSGSESDLFDLIASVSNQSRSLRKAKEKKESAKRAQASKTDHSNTESSSCESCLQLAREVTVRSDTSESSVSPSLLSQKNTRKQKRNRKNPTTPPTQLSLSTEANVRLPSPDYILPFPDGQFCLPQDYVLPYPDSLPESPVAAELEEAAADQVKETASGILTVLNQVSKLSEKGKKPQKKGRSRASGKRVTKLQKTADDDKSLKVEEVVASSPRRAKISNHGSAALPRIPKKTVKDSPSIRDQKEVGEDAPSTTKRGPGRPKKTVKDSPSIRDQKEVGEDAPSTTKRGPGRPKKCATSDTKKRPGRPKKCATSDAKRSPGATTKKIDSVIKSTPRYQMYIKGNGSPKRNKDSPTKLATNKPAASNVTREKMQYQYQTRDHKESGSGSPKRNRYESTANKPPTLTATRAGMQHSPAKIHLSSHKESENFSPSTQSNRGRGHAALVDLQSMYSHIVSPEIDVVNFTPEYNDPTDKDQAGLRQYPSIIIDNTDDHSYLSPEIGMMNRLRDVSKSPSHHSTTSTLVERTHTVSTRSHDSQLPVSQSERFYMLDDEYEQSQALSQYSHAPVQRVARQTCSSDSSSVVSGSTAAMTRRMLSIPTNMYNNMTKNT